MRKILLGATALAVAAMGGSAGNQRITSDNESRIEAVGAKQAERSTTPKPTATSTSARRAKRTDMSLILGARSHRRQAWVLRKQGGRLVGVHLQ